MSKRIETVTKDRPDLVQREDVREVAQDIDQYAALAGFASTEAGGILTKALTADAAASILSIIHGYKTLPDVEMRAHAAQLETRVSLLRSLRRASTNLELAEAVLTELIN